MLDAQRPFLDALDTWDAWERWPDAVLAHYRSQPHWGCPIGALTAELIRNEPDRATELAAHMDRWRGYLEAGLQQMRDSGQLQPEANPRTLALSTFAALQGGLLLTQMMESIEPLEAALEGALTALRDAAATSPTWINTRSAATSGLQPKLFCVPLVARVGWAPRGVARLPIWQDGARMERVETITRAYRTVMAVSAPAVRWWGRLEVLGLEHLPLDGPVLLAGNHDSYWDPVAVGIAGLPRRQIKALAKASLWKPGIGKVLDGMGQIPIDRGAGDARALDQAVEELRRGACIGVFPEGTRSLGRKLRARSGIGRLAEAVPEARVVSCAVEGTVDIPKFPKNRPRVRVTFFEPAGGGLEPGESPGDFAQRLLAEIRGRAPIRIAGRKSERQLPADP